jgi:hypothetical protein
MAMRHFLQSLPIGNEADMNATKTGSVWVFLIGLLAMLVLLGAFAQTAGRNSGSLASTISPTNMTGVIPSGSPPPSVTNTPEIEPTEEPTADLSATETAWPLTQAASWPTFEAWQTAHPIIDPTPITGIVDATGPVIVEEHVYENGWQNWITDQWTVVGAGAYRDNPVQGIVAFGMFAEEVYETPLQAGSVHIIDEQNYRLTLLSTDGTTFYFDIPGRRFVESLTEVVPTITPTLPSPTPTPTITPTFNPTWLTPWPTCTPIPPSTATREPCGP